MGLYAPSGRRTADTTWKKHFEELLKRPLCSRQSLKPHPYSWQRSLTKLLSGEAPDDIYLEMLNAQEPAGQTIIWASHCSARPGEACIVKGTVSSIRSTLKSCFCG